MLRTRYLPAGLLALTLAFSVVLAACSSEASASPTASASASAADSIASGSAEASSSAAESVALPSLDLPSSAADLEAILPDEIGGQPVTKLSMAGDEFIGSGQTDESFEDFLGRVGAEPDDVSVAFAFSTSQAGSGVIAFRVAGASQDEMLGAFQAASDAEGDVVGWTDANVGGKSVKVATQVDGATPMYLYPRGDILFIVTAPSEDAAAEILSALP